MSTLKLWLDDERPAPEGWHHARSVNEAIHLVRSHTGHGWEIASLDNDLGRFTEDGGEGYRFVDWMEANDRWPLHPPTVHSMNPVRSRYMRQVISRSFPRNTC